VITCGDIIICTLKKGRIVGKSMEWQFHVGSLYCSNHIYKCACTMRIKSTPTPYVWYNYVVPTSIYTYISTVIFVSHYYSWNMVFAGWNQ